MKGNEEADKAANEAREEDQKAVEIDWKVCKTAIERGLKQKVQRDERCSIIYSSKIKRKYHDRVGNVIMTQLRSGHCPKTKYKNEKRIGKSIDARCDECGEEEDKDHIWECVRWEKECRRLGMDGLGALREEEVSLKYLRKTKKDWLI